MSVYQLKKDQIVEIAATTFAKAKITERGDLQRLLRDKIEIISPDTLVIAEEFGDWEDSKRRIDLLGLDKDANLVVIELKRTQDGGHMELQAIRYAAMVSTLTFEKAVEVFENYLKARQDEANARQTILDFLEWEEPNEEDFGSDVRIVLASAEFSKELTSAVLWLCDHGIDVRCVRIRPHGDANNILLDVQQIIPLPEAEDFQIRAREKHQKERAARKVSRDFSRYNVTIDGTTLENLSKSQAVFVIVQNLCKSGTSPEQINDSLEWRLNVFRSTEGEVDAETFKSRLALQKKVINTKGWFASDEELIHFAGNTFAFTRKWGPRAEEAMTILAETFKPNDISFEKITS